MLVVEAMLYLDFSMTFLLNGPWYSGGNETKLSETFVYTFSSPLSGYYSLLHVTLFACFLPQILPYESFFSSQIFTDCLFFFIISVIILSLRCFGGKEAVVWSRDLGN